MILLRIRPDNRKKSPSSSFESGQTTARNHEMILLRSTRVGAVEERVEPEIHHPTLNQSHTQMKETNSSSSPRLSCGSSRPPSFLVLAW
mmetsp:Transcript_22531/g.35238  ORF Transcript_22531/g.35238 Transcript_22531/m.35238 type:complete len:89 (+) Transcript_22531:765-1031(+)